MFSSSSPLLSGEDNKIIDILTDLDKDLRYVDLSLNPMELISTINFMIRKNSKCVLLWTPVITYISRQKYDVKELSVTCHPWVKETGNCLHTIIILTLGRFINPDFSYENLPDYDGHINNNAYLSITSRKILAIEAKQKYFTFPVSMIERIIKTCVIIDPICSIFLHYSRFNEISPDSVLSYLQANSEYFNSRDFRKYKFYTTLRSITDKLTDTEETFRKMMKSLISRSGKRLDWVWYDLKNELDELYENIQLGNLTNVPFKIIKQSHDAYMKKVSDVIYHKMGNKDISNFLMTYLILEDPLEGYTTQILKSEQCILS